ncbi:MAG: membrane dipeptidase [Deltaproteobacteria bacterium]
MAVAERLGPSARPTRTASRAWGLCLALLPGACGSSPSLEISSAAHSPDDDPAEALHREATREASRTEERTEAQRTEAQRTEAQRTEAPGETAPPPEVSPSGPSGQGAPSEPPSPQPGDEVLVAIDTHSDTTQRLLDEHADLSARLEDGHLDLPRMREGGLTAVFMSLWVDPRRFRGEAAWERTRALVAAVRAFVAAHPDEVALATTAAEVRAAARARRVAFLMGLEGAHGLGENEPDVLLERLAELARGGVRYVTLTWTNDNAFGHASTGAHPRRGLTETGRALVARMNALGVMVDVSHVSDRTALDAIEASRAPVIASHSGARAVGDHPRNLPDAILRRIGETRGAVCVNYYAQFVDPTYGEARRALAREHRAEFDALPHGRSWSTSDARNALARRLAPALRPPTLRRLGEHFAHIAHIAGPHVPCLGSDFDGVGELPSGMRDVSDLPALFRELERRHLEVRAIAGDNVLRVMESAERAAAR